MPQKTEHSVVTEVFYRVHGRDRERMYRSLDTHKRADIDKAIASLEEVGIVVSKGQRVFPTPALKRLGDLGLIGL